MRAHVVAVLAMVAGCAQAGQPGPGASGDDQSPAIDAPLAIDALIPPDACADTDTDGVCNIVDKCPGFDDAVDTDLDTIADGCDRCAGVDDRVDVNTNMVPDCLELVTRTIDLKAVGSNLWRGWHASGGGHMSSNDNTLTGELAGTYNSYYVFSLTGFTATTVSSVTLELQLESYSSTDASEMMSVWDVSTPAATVETVGTDANVYSDLMTGMKYGMVTATSAQLNQLLSIPLSAQAALDVKAKLGGDFVVGAHLDTAPGWIRFGNTGTGAAPTIIRIVVKYLP